MAWELPIDPPEEIDPRRIDPEGTEITAPPQVEAPALPQAAPQAPMGPLSAVDLGVSPQLIAAAQGQGMPPGMPPQGPMGPPAALLDPRQQFLRAVISGLMMGAGPRSGFSVGAGQGLEAGQHNLQQAIQQQFLRQQAEQQRLAAIQAANTRAEAVREAERQRQFLGAVQTMSARAKQIPTKAQYDQEVEGWANVLLSSGFRITANQLRQMVPFVAPSGKKIAGEAVNNFLKNPANKQVLENPDLLAKVYLAYDQDGDGIPEQVPLLRAAEVAGIPFAVDAGGRLLEYPKGTTQEAKIGIDAEFNDALGIAKAEGKDITDPTVRQVVREVVLKRASARKAEEKVAPDESAQLRDVIVDGAPAVVLFHPKSQMVTDLDLNPLDASRVKPMPPAAQLRGDDPVAMERRRRLVSTVMGNPSLWDDLTPTLKGEIAADLATQGFSGFGKTLPASAVTKMAESRAALDSLKDLRRVLQENEKFIGPLAGLAALNPWSDARQAQAKIDLVKQRVGKALEGGVLRKEDEEKYKKILATLRDTPETAIYKVDNVIQNLENDLARFVDEQRMSGRRVSPEQVPAKKPAAGPSGLSYEDYLRQRGVKR